MKGRAEPKRQRKLGPPSKHLRPDAAAAFELFREEIPWLKTAHRSLVEMASVLRANFESGVYDLKEMQELRRILGQLGATPADESKIAHGDTDGEPDADEAFFGRPN